MQKNKCCLLNCFNFMQVLVGDEIDLIKGANTINPAFLDVSRVIVLAVDSTGDPEKVGAILKRYKTLTIDNYSSAPYKRATNVDG